MKRSVPVGEVRRLGDRAFLIGSADPVSGRALARALEVALAGSGQVEVVCGFATVAVLVPDVDAELEAVRAVAQQVVAARAAHGEGGGDPPGRFLTIPCTFDGPDLPEVAAVVGLDPGAVVAQLTARPLTAAVVGFSPGFAYLDGLPEALAARPPTRPPAPTGARGLRRPRQRARRRVPDGVTGWLAARGSHRRHPPLTRAPPLRGAGPGGPGAADRGRHRPRG